MNLDSSREKVHEHTYTLLQFFTQQCAEKYIVFNIVKVKCDIQNCGWGTSIQSLCIYASAL